ncbi:MAG: GNAT family N-acetyltransferase [Azoarcus sp.]|jgi:GNAT superfamily N-acetyltransferase|nr:GNAT family N-acetyltransferase [Azoarcus sp.]
MVCSIISVVDEAAMAEWLPRAEAVHRQLRDRLPPGFDAYRTVLERVLAGGARLDLAVEGEAVRGLALWRIIENTYEGRRLYVDDLVTDAACRSQGVGHALVNWLAQQARILSCTALALDSGVQRAAAHRFYFREGFIIPSFCFRKTLT